MIIVYELKAIDHKKELRYCKEFNRFTEVNSADVLDMTFLNDES